MGLQGAIDPALAFPVLALGAVLPAEPGKGVPRLERSAAGFTGAPEGFVRVREL